VYRYVISYLAYVLKNEGGWYLALSAYVLHLSLSLSLSANTGTVAAADCCFHFISDHHSPLVIYAPHLSLIPVSCCMPTHLVVFYVLRFFYGS
jgi:hypothetical protein